MPGFRVWDMESWPRREHYAYYTGALPVGFTVTAPLDVTAVLDACHRRGIKFYPAFVWCVTRVVNRTECLRMFTDGEGRLCVWDAVVPNYTVFHPEDETFSDMWTEYREDFADFYAAMLADMAAAAQVRGIKAKPGQPANFYCISMVPWLEFTGSSTFTAGGRPQFFPIITAGKYRMEGDGRCRLPMSFTIAHAVCDGFHASRFFADVQKELDAFGQEG